MSSETVTKMPFRELPGRAKVVLPKWSPQPEEDVTYSVNMCRGVPQNVVHDVSCMDGDTYGVLYTTVVDVVVLTLLVASLRGTLRTQNSLTTCTSTVVRFSR